MKHFWKNASIRRNTVPARMRLTACLMILAVSESGVIAVLVGDGAAVMELDTSVADIRSLIQPGAPFLLEPFACLVACRA